MKIKCFTLVLLCGLLIMPQEMKAEKEVTLVVSSDGTTKEEATKFALRSAIEQAYGTFVSANTTILNDEMVKDEVATITSGNIQSYKEISSNTLPDGRFYVTLQATVSVSKLVHYAESKGAEVELAGATLGANIKMIELNQKNEELAIKHLSEQIVQMYPFTFSYELEMSEPVLSRGAWEINFRVYVKPNKSMKSLSKTIKETLRSLRMSNREIKEYKKLGIDYYTSENLDKYFEGIVKSYSLNKYGTCFRSNHHDTEEYLAKKRLPIILYNFNIVDNHNNSIAEIKTNSRGELIRSRRGSSFYFREELSLDNSFLDLTFNSTQLLCTVRVKIPKDEISKYSNFRVEKQTLE